MKIVLCKKFIRIVQMIFTHYKYFLQSMVFTYTKHNYWRRRRHLSPSDAISLGQHKFENTNFSASFDVYTSVLFVFELCFVRECSHAKLLFCVCFHARKCACTDAYTQLAYFHFTSVHISKERC